MASLLADWLNLGLTRMAEACSIEDAVSIAERACGNGGFRIETPVPPKVDRLQNF